MKAIFTFLSIASAICAQSTLAPPQIGFIQDVRGGMRPVLGVAGNFLIGGAVSSRIVSAAYSGSVGLMKTDTALIVTDKQGHAIASTVAPPGSALFAFSADSRTALAYLDRTQELMVWNGRAFKHAALDATSLPAKTVLSIAVDNATLAELLVERESELWELQVRIETGAVVSQMALPGVAAPALLLAGGLVYGNERGVVLRKNDGSEKQIAARLPKSFTLQQMGDGWVQVRDLATSRPFAISVQSGREAYYALPEVRQ